MKYFSSILLSLVLVSGCVSNKAIQTVQAGDQETRKIFLHLFLLALTHEILLCLYCFFLLHLQTKEEVHLSWINYRSGVSSIDQINQTNAMDKIPQVWINYINGAVN